MPKLSFLTLLSSLFFCALFLLATAQACYAASEPEIRISVSEFGEHETEEYGIVYRTQNGQLEFRPTLQAGYYQLFTPSRYPRNQNAPELVPLEATGKKTLTFFCAN